MDDAANGGVLPTEAPDGKAGADEVQAVKTHNSCARCDLLRPLQYVTIKGVCTGWFCAECAEELKYIKGGPSDAAKNVIQERASTHGDYNQNSELAQRLKSLLRIYGDWGSLSAYKKESLDLMCTKLARIIVGNSDEPDHWKDLAGYSLLVHNILTKGTHL